jgi:hypothetical protein
MGELEEVERLARLAAKVRSEGGQVLPGFGIAVVADDHCGHHEMP